MRDVTMNNLVLGQDYFDEDGCQFTLIGVSRNLQEIRNNGFTLYVQGHIIEYEFRYQTGIAIKQEFDPRRIFKEEIKEKFKFGRKCLYSNLVEE